MDPQVGATECHPLSLHDSDQRCHSHSPVQLGRQINDYMPEEFNMHYTQLPSIQLNMEHTELLGNQQDIEHTQFLLADANDLHIVNDLCPSSLSPEFTEQCVHTLDAISDPSCLAVSDEHLSLPSPGEVSVEGRDQGDSSDGLRSDISVEILETGDANLLWLSSEGTEMTPLTATEDGDVTQLENDASELDCTVQPIISIDLSCTPFPRKCLQPQTATPALASSAEWPQRHQDGCPLPESAAIQSEDQLAWQHESPNGPAPSSQLPLESVLTDPVVMDSEAAWAPSLFTEDRSLCADAVGGVVDGWRPPPLPLPSSAPRLAEVECELTVSEETEQELAPPGGGTSADLVPYQEHNYDYPLEPLVAGEVRPNADHQYASRPASPSDAACSATDHRYAYSPPAALTEEDLIRSISDQLGLPQDHGYSQRHFPSVGQPLPLTPQSTLPIQSMVQPGIAITPTWPTETGGTHFELLPEPCAEPCLVMESCPPDWDPTLDEPAGHCVNPNLVMGISTDYLEQEGEVGNDSGGSDGDEGGTMAELFDGVDTVLLDRDLCRNLYLSESGPAVIGGEGSKYVVLDVLQPDSVISNLALDEAAADTNEQVERAPMSNEDMQALDATNSLGYYAGSELVLSEKDSELNQLLWTAGGSSLVPTETETLPVESEHSQNQSATDPFKPQQYRPSSDSLLHRTGVVKAVPAGNLPEKCTVSVIDSTEVHTLSADGSSSAEMTRCVSVASDSSCSIPFSLMAEPNVSPPLRGASPKEKDTQPPDIPPYDVVDSSALPDSRSSGQPEKLPLSDSLPAPMFAEEPVMIYDIMPAATADLPPLTLPDTPPATSPPPQHETNIVISRTVDGTEAAAPLSPLPVPSRVPEADPAAMVRSWLRRRIESQQPVTRAQLSYDLTALLGPERRHRLSDSSAFLAQWLDRLVVATAKESAETKNTTSAGEKQARLGYPPEFKLLVLRFAEFMPPDKVAAAFCVRFSLLYKWRAKRRELTQLAAADADCVRAKGAGKKRRSTEVDDEFYSWLEQREQDSGDPPSYGEVRHMAKQLYAGSGLKVPRFRLCEREHSVTNRRRDDKAIRWLLSEFELGSCTNRAALTAYGLQPGGRDWAARLLALYPALRRPLNTWQMTLPEPLLIEAELWAGTLELVPPHAVIVMVDVPIATKPAPCAVWKYEDSEHLATLLITCTLDGSQLPPVLILKGGGRRVYSDSSGLLVAEQEAGKLDAARAGLWLQLVGRRGTPKLLLLNSCCAPRPDQLRSQAAAAGCRLALVPSGLAAAANPLMATRQQLTMSIAAELSLVDGSVRAALLAAVRSQLVGWGDGPQLRQDLARARRLYSPPVG